MADPNSQPFYYFRYLLSHRIHWYLNCNGVSGVEFLHIGLLRFLHPNIGMQINHSRQLFKIRGMRNLSLTVTLLIITCSFSSLMCATSKQKGKIKFHVAGSIMQTASYCGGAQPSQEILDSFNTPRGIPFEKLFIKEGLTNGESSNIVDTVIANANGNFSIDLPRGNYCFVEEWKSGAFKLPLKSKDQTIDSSCYKNLYNTCDFQLNIENKDVENIKIIFHRKCSFNQPCIPFHGSLPPIAPSH
jgi:hypothetical protein